MLVGELDGGAGQEGSSGGILMSGPAFSRDIACNSRAPSAAALTVDGGNVCPVSLCPGVWAPDIRFVSWTAGFLLLRATGTADKEAPLRRTCGGGNLPAYKFTPGRCKKARYSGPMEAPWWSPYQQGKTALQKHCPSPLPLSLDRSSAAQFCSAWPRCN